MVRSGRTLSGSAQAGPILGMLVEKVVSVTSPSWVRRDEPAGPALLAYTHGPIVVILRQHRAGQTELVEAALASDSGMVEVVDAAGNVRVDLPTGTFRVDSAAHPVEYAQVLAHFAEAAARIPDSG